MNARIRAGAAGLALGLLSATLPVLATDTHELRSLRERGDILPLDAILRLYRAAEPGGRLLEAELEHEDDRLVYELKVLDADGSLRQYLYDPHTGERLQTRSWQQGHDAPEPR